MNSFRDPKYVERYEDISFNLETTLKTVLGNNRRQNKDVYRFVVDNSGEVTPFDWYNARIVLDFKVNKLAGGAIAVNDHNGIVNHSSSFINSFNIKVSGKQVYDCNNVNHCVNIKSLLEFNHTYAKSTATNEFFYLDTNRDADEVAGAGQNKGFAARKAFLGTSSTVSTEIQLNRYSFFEYLNNELLPNTKIELNIKIESDNNLIWQDADDCRVIIMQMKLVVPRITFNSVGQTLYLSKYLKPHKWTYLSENVESSISTRQRTGTFKITSGISRPRHVFIFINDTAKNEDQKENIFLYDTFSVADNQQITECHLEVGSGIRYPEGPYTPATDSTRVFRDVLKYVHVNNEYQEGTLLSRYNFHTIHSFLYFDLTHQQEGIKDGVTKLLFKYTLSGTPNADYTINAITLYEQDIELEQVGGKILLRT